MEEEDRVDLLFEYMKQACSVVGLTGNILALYLLQTRIHLKSQISQIYLFALSLCSSIFLVSVLCSLGPDYDSSLFGCRVFNFVAHWSDFACVWLIAVVCADRVLLLKFSSFRTRKVTKSTALLVTCFIILVSAAACSWLLVIPALQVVQHSNGKNFTACGVEPVMLKIYSIFNVTETVFSVMIPAVLITWSNLYISKSIYKLKAKGILVKASATENANNNNVNAQQSPLLNSEKKEGSPVQQEEMKIILSNPENRKIMSEQRREPTDPLFDLDSDWDLPAPAPIAVPVNDLRYRKAMNAVDMKLSFTLLVVTTAFLVLNIPSYISRFMAMASYETTWTGIFGRVAYILYYFHHAILFYLYIFNSKEMRKELFACLCCL